MKPLTHNKTGTHVILRPELLHEQTSIVNSIVITEDMKFKGSAKIVSENPGDSKLVKISGDPLLDLSKFIYPVEAFIELECGDLFMSEDNSIVKILELNKNLLCTTKLGTTSLSDADESWSVSYYIESITDEDTIMYGHNCKDSYTSVFMKDVDDYSVFRQLFLNMFIFHEDKFRYIAYIDNYGDVLLIEGMNSYIVNIKDLDLTSKVYSKFPNKHLANDLSTLFKTYMNVNYLEKEESV